MRQLYLTDFLPLVFCFFFSLLAKTKLHGKPKRVHFTENFGNYQFGIHWHTQY